MPYQYGQGFTKDLNSLVHLIKKENTIDFDPVFLEDEIKKILKYNHDNLGPKTDSIKESQTPKELNEILKKIDAKIEQIWDKNEQCQKNLENSAVSGEYDPWNDKYESQVTGLIDAKKIIKDSLGPKIDSSKNDEFPKENKNNLEKIDEKTFQVSDIAENEKINFTDKQSHYIQNQIDLVMDMISDEKIKEKLEEIRDSIPCSCGTEDQ